jgi:hypothetical protein
MWTQYFSGPVSVVDIFKLVMVHPKKKIIYKLQGKRHQNIWFLKRIIKMHQNIWFLKRNIKMASSLCLQRIMLFLNALQGAERKTNWQSRLECHCGQTWGTSTPWHTAGPP